MAEHRRYRDQTESEDLSFFPVQPKPKKPGLIRRAIDFITGRKKPEPPSVIRRGWREQELVEGTQQEIGQIHGGTARRDNQNPDLSEENTEQWKWIKQQDVVDFLYRGKPLLVHSSNVKLFQYDRNKNALYIEFLNNAGYVYDEISPMEAYHIISQWSKGTSVWDNLRIRGTKYGHRKPYRRVK